MKVRENSTRNWEDYFLLCTACTLVYIAGELSGRSGEHPSNRDAPSKFGRVNWQVCSIHADCPKWPGDPCIRVKGIFFCPSLKTVKGIYLFICSSFRPSVRPSTHAMQSCVNSACHPSFDKSWGLSQIMLHLWALGMFIKVMSMPRALFVSHWLFLETFSRN